MDALSERTGFLSVRTEEAGGSAGLARKSPSLHRHSYTPITSPQSPHSPRVGQTWRTGQANPYGGWFRPSPSSPQAQKQ
eukprot:scaffold3.g6708.t1